MAAAADASSPERANKFRLAGIAAIVVFGFEFLNFGDASNRVDSDGDITSSVRVASVNMPVPKGGGTYRVGNPYVIAGRVYKPREEPSYRGEGIASWYGEKFHGRLTANGEKFDMHALSAAHPTLPLPSYVRVTNLENRRSLIVRLNDRGPYRDARLIDVSVRTAKLLGFYDRGLVQVRVDYIGPAELEGSDDAVLAATLSQDYQLAMELFEGAPLMRSIAGRSDDVESGASTPSAGLIEPLIGHTWGRVVDVHGTPMF